MCLFFCKQLIIELGCALCAVQLNGYGKVYINSSWVCFTSQGVLHHLQYCVSWEQWRVSDFRTEILKFTSSTFRSNLLRGTQPGRTVADPDKEDRQVIRYVAGSIMRGYLIAFKNHNVTLNLGKCKIRVIQCQMFGYSISVKGITPQHSKTQPILEMPMPKDVTALRSFMGSVNYLMKFWLIWQK